jgi:hypothetical protein
MLTGNIHSFVDGSTARSHNYGRVLLNAIGRSLIALSFYLRNVGSAARLPQNYRHLRRA